MIQTILGYLVFSFFSGCLFGILYAWKKKAFFWAWVILLALSILDYTIDDKFEFTPPEIAPWWCIPSIIIGLAGMKVGERFYMVTFQKSHSQRKKERHATG